MLKIENIGKTYKKSNERVRALEGVSLEAEAGEFVIVRGPSGCGKTTLLLSAGALLAPESGRVLIGDRDPYALGLEERARLRGESIGFVFQQFHLVPYLTVLENVMAPSLAVAHGDARARASELIERLGLASRARHVPAELSTGERQRTALARAFLNRPSLLLADEPTGNLDPDNAAIVLEHIAEFARDGGIVLMVTHDDAPERFANRVVRLNEGRLA